MRIAGDEQITFGEGNLAFGDNITFIWGTSRWQWNRWYSRGKVASFASGMLARSIASLRLRREIARRHRQRPYDLVYQFSSIETPAVPAAVRARRAAGHSPRDAHRGRAEMADRRATTRSALPARLRPRDRGDDDVLRTLVQRRTIGARACWCASAASFAITWCATTDFPARRRRSCPNPVRAERFSTRRTGRRRARRTCSCWAASRAQGHRGCVGVAQAAARARRRRAACASSADRACGRTTRSCSTISRPRTSEYAGLGIRQRDREPTCSKERRALQASKYEPFGLTVAEALAAGVPVVATSEVGAIEGVDRSVVREVAPGDVAGMASAIAELLERSCEPGLAETRAQPRAPRPARLFAPDRRLRADLGRARTAGRGLASAATAPPGQVADSEAEARRGLLDV